MSDDKPQMTGREMVEGYLHWHGSPQVVGLLNHLRTIFPKATELELRNHVLQYTLVKLTVWIVPPDEAPGGKEPWQQ